MNRHKAYGKSGTVQKRPTDFLGTSRRNAFQQVLIRFLIASREYDANANIIKDFEVYATCGNQYFSFKPEGEKVRKAEETSLKCSHDRSSRHS